MGCILGQWGPGDREGLHLELNCQHLVSSIAICTTFIHDHVEFPQFVRKSIDDLLSKFTWLVGAVLILEPRAVPRKAVQAH